jgi:recombination protein RecA
MSAALEALKAVTNKGKPAIFPAAHVASAKAAKEQEKGKPEESKVDPKAALTRDQALAALANVGKVLDTKFKTTNSIVRLGSKLGLVMPHISTKIPSLDNGVLGIGGVPRGRVIEIFGPESAGKTTMALEFISAEQAEGGLAAFVDAEHALDPNYAKSLGVDVANLYVSQPDSGEQALETVIELVESRAVSIIVVDSVAALVPQAELDGDMGDSHMGLQARLMSQAMRKLRGIVAINNVTVIFINQIREKIGVMFGSPETTTGGRALKFYASVRLDVRRLGGDNGKITVGTGDNAVLIGHRMKIKAVKNKVGPPFRETIVDVIYGKGIDRFADTVRFGVQVGAIEKSGSWLSFKGERLGQGTDNAILTLRSNDALMEQVRAEIDLAIKAAQEADNQ